MYVAISTEGTKYFKKLSSAKKYALEYEKKRTQNEDAAIDWIPLRRSNGTTSYRSKSYYPVIIDKIVTED